MASQRPSVWHLHRRSAPVRSDAEGLFVPDQDLPDAQVGDRVAVHGPDDDTERMGTIVELVPRNDETYFRLDLDSDSG